jgi:glycosyltransferase involved in cell wall biosynthesis
VRVGVDGRSLVGGGARGVAHYTSALLGALAAEFPGDEWRVLLPRGPVGPLPPGLTPVRSPLPGRVLFGAAALARRPRLEDLLGGDVDVVWAPAPAPLAVGRRTPFVLTVHDRSWEQRPADFTRYERAWHRAGRLPALARRADRVLCDAEVVRRDLLAAWGLAAERVQAVHLAPAPGAVAPVRPAPAPPPGARYLLFVGALEPRKAPDVLVAAHARARADGLESELWLAGTGRLGPRLDGPGVRRLGHVADAERAALYAGALALVLPSRLEGFGLAPVEALATGTPVVAGDLPVLREVLGDDGALWVTPGDADGLARALLRVEREPDLRAALARAGRTATAGLSWAATARATRAVLAEAAAR